MPPVIGAIGAIGAWATGGALAAGTIGAAMVGGAIVGAAVGGITAAVTGGSILKGMLFGAVGGAVTGGLGQWASGAGGALQAATTSTNLAQGTATPAIVNAAAGSTSSMLTASGELAASGGGFLGSIGGGATLLKGGLDMVGGMLQSEDASAEAAAQREWQAEQNQKQRDLQEKLASMSGGGGGGSSDGIAIARINQETALKQLGENRRQYDVAREDALGATKRSGQALAQVRASTKAYKTAGTRSIDEASAETETKRVGMLEGARGDEVQVAEVQPAAPAIENEQLAMVA